MRFTEKCLKFLLKKFQMFSKIAILYILIHSKPFVNCSYEIWPDAADDGRENQTKPKTWQEKDYGQWCRNRSIVELVSDWKNIFL